MSSIQRRVRVEGRVQGVGFRAATAAEAARFPEVEGWVRNLPDGAVEALFRGPADDVLMLVAWCRRGPPSSKVLRLEVKEEPCPPPETPKGSVHRFQIRS